MHPSNSKFKVSLHKNPYNKRVLQFLTFGVIPEMAHKSYRSEFIFAEMHPQAIYQYDETNIDVILYW
jgi:hypothetical protein